MVSFVSCGSVFIFESIPSCTFSIPAVMQRFSSAFRWGNKPYWSFPYSIGSKDCWSISSRQQILGTSLRRLLSISEDKSGSGVIATAEDSYALICLYNIYDIYKYIQYIWYTYKYIQCIEEYAPLKRL